MSGTPTAPPSPLARRADLRRTAAAWARLLRLPALCTVPGDALAGAAAAAGRRHRGTALAVGASLCLYEAGMVLNDWADRHTDAVERPERPLPSGEISPEAALTAAVGLTAAGLGLAAAAGRPALTTATVLGATVWGYDLWLKRTPAGPAAMACARSLDLLLGAVAGTGRTRRPGGTRTALRAAAPAAALLGAHTLAVTAVSRDETRGGSAVPSAAALATVGAVTGVLGGVPSRPRRRARPAGPFAGVYAHTAARPLAHAALNPSPPLLQRAVGGGIRAVIPLQAALAARAGAVRTAWSLLGLLPVARRLSRRVSPT